MSYPKANSSDRTLHTEVAITEPGKMEYKVIVEKSCHCASDIMIVVNDREIEMKQVFFSKLLVDVVCCVVFNLLILWPQVPMMFKVVMYPLTTPPY